MTPAIALSMFMLSFVDTCYCTVHVYVVICWHLPLYWPCLCCYSLTPAIVLSMFMLSFVDTCYCTVHVYVVFHSWDNMGSFWLERISARCFYRFLIYVLPLKVQLSRGEGGDAINRFNTATFLVSVPKQNLDFQCHKSCFF